MYLPQLGVHTLRSATRAFGCHLFCALSLLAAGWSTPAAAAGSLNRFEYLRAQDLRVFGVAYRLAISSRQLCGESSAPQIGFILHDLAQYGLPDREGAAQAYGLGSHIGVMAVVDGSPAETAGLQAGDQLVSVNGRILDTNSGTEAPTTEFVESARRIVMEEMRKGDVTLRVVTTGGHRDVRFTATTGCPSDVQLVPGAGVNAWADGERVMVTDAIVAQCPTDDDLALVIAHELGHNLLHHRRRLTLAGIPDSTFPPVAAAGLAMVRVTEEEADRFAVRMASAAGYDLSGSASFLGGLLEANGRNGRAAATHPQAGRRLALLKATIAQTGAVMSAAL